MASKQKLYDALVEAIPSTGKITYEELQASLTASGNREALNVFRQMKKRGDIHAEVIANDDGTFTHNVWRGTPST
jgi:hypothetical protein